MYPATSLIGEDNEKRHPDALLRKDSSLLFEPGGRSMLCFSEVRLRSSVDHGRRPMLEYIEGFW